MTRVYYKEAVGAFVVFDVTRGSTFEAVSKWKHDLDSKVKLANGSPIPSVLLANKCDQKKETTSNTSLMDNFCRETGFLGWFETSAKVRYERERDWERLALETIRHSGNRTQTHTHTLVV
jgi:Ras-related protein Rab-32